MKLRHLTIGAWLVLGVIGLAWTACVGYFAVLVIRALLKYLGS